MELDKENYYNEPFARNYDKFTKGRYYDYAHMAKDFKEIVNGKSILELGIGTGCLAEEMIKQSYIVEGIEPSQPMISELERKNLPIKIYKQDVVELNTGKKYDAIYSLGAVPLTIFRKNGLFFDTYVLKKENFQKAMTKVYEHLKNRGYFMCSTQEGSTDSTEVGDFYKSKSVFFDDLIAKTHQFKDKDKWTSQIVRARMWRERDFTKMMEQIGFNTIGLSNNKTWYVFRKI